MIDRVVNWVLHKDPVKPSTPACPDHKIPMLLRGSMGTPARADGQSEATYTQIYYCGAPQCNQTAQVTRLKSQGAAPVEAPERPEYVRPEEG